MIEIRFHGRGGQGAVVASNVLSLAFFKEGKAVQSFPSFGGERRGAPVMAFVRVDDHELGIRCNVYQPDQVVVLDVSLTQTMDVTAGLKKGGWVLINSSRPPDSFSFLSQYATATVDANDIAIKHHLGTPTSPIVNTAILGALSKVTGLVSIDAVVAAINESVPDNAEANGSAAIEAYKSITYKKKA